MIFKIVSKISKKDLNFFSTELHLRKNFIYLKNLINLESICFIRKSYPVFDITKNYVYFSIFNAILVQQFYYYYKYIFNFKTLGRYYIIRNM